MNDSAGRMRILLEPGSYSLENVGDVAMLQVATRRLRELWPEARIGVVTEAPKQLSMLCPGTEPILARRERCEQDAPPTAVSGLLSRMVWPRLWRPPRRADEAPERTELAASVRGADLVVASGMGALNDSFAPRALRLLGTFAIAKRCGVPTALFSQGLGPVRDEAFKARVARALAGVDLIALRERLSGPALLNHMGVPREVVRVTGDDAIELAYEERPPAGGECLGVNVRVADYSGVDDAAVGLVRTVLREAASRLRTRVLPIPISHRHGGLDARTNRALLRDLDPASDGGATLLTPLDVIRQVGRCRLVVAGSYHAGVFALAQGIPAVCLVNSPYYGDKFRGLADMFGRGCEIVSLNEGRFPSLLAAAIDRAWESARHDRAGLLAAATEQVTLGHEAYRDLLILPGRRTPDAAQARAAGC